jgi:thiosulfate/3-mercaptopyruvate sulfurtransferase
MSLVIERVFMKKMIRDIKLLHALILFVVLVPFSLAQNETSLIVSTSFLEKNLNDPKLILLHYSKIEDFEKEHIPNARLVSLGDLIVEKENGLRHELPDDEKIESVIRSWGVNNDSKIVICYGDEKALMIATRLYFTLDYAGLGDQTSILNGGLVKWKNEDRKVTPDIVKYKPGNFQIKVNSNALADKKWILENIDNSEIVIVDSRPEAQYSGEAEDHNSSRKGHIQGAVNIPFYNLQVEEEPFLLKDQNDLRKMFEDNFIAENITILTYCGSGMYAAPVYFVAKYLGYHVKLYDASFQEWGNDETLPITSPVEIISD